MEKKIYEVEYVHQIANGKYAVEHEMFDSFDQADEFANKICLESDDVICCTIWKNDSRVMDVL